MARPWIIVAGLAVLALLLGIAFYIQWDAHMALEGRVMKVRTLNAVDEATIVVLDARLNNTAGSTYIVGDIKVEVEDAKGGKTEGIAVAEMDADRVFASYPALGQRFNPNLKVRDKLPAKSTVDRQFSVQFPLRGAAVAARKRLIVTVRELDGLESQIAENPLMKSN
ncbi:MAG: hypothetical protein K2X03_04875 [Bryobacteraceae bacterium]|nr:hypothetical protein [Bryobacteraceae bacterium]